MAKIAAETKGPVGEEFAPVPEAPDLAQVLAAQAKLADILSKVAPLAFTAAARAEELAQRVEGLEKANLALVEIIRQLHGVLQEVAVARR